MPPPVAFGNEGGGVGPPAFLRKQEGGVGGEPRPSTRPSGGLVKDGLGEDLRITKCV